MRTDEWETPQELYDKLDKEFHFDLDPCSTEWNHKTPWYYSRAGWPETTVGGPEGVVQSSVLKRP